MLTAAQVDKLKGKICPYCNRLPELITADKIYGNPHKYGRQFIWICKPCDAYVGCHVGTKEPKGRLAKKQLRILKKEAHTYFDMLWMYDMMPVAKNRKEQRAAAYKWLGEMLKTPPEFTHIGMFNETSCRNVIFYSKQLLNDLRRLDLDCGIEPKTDYFEDIEDVLTKIFN